MESTEIFSIIFLVDNPNLKSSRYSKLVPKEKPVTLDLYPEVDHLSVTEDSKFKLRLLSEFLKFGLETHNLQENLVKMRAGSEIIKRRSSKRYIFGEWQSLRFLFGIGHFNYLLFVFHFISRTSVRIFPFKIIKFLYTKLLRK